MVGLASRQFTETKTPKDKLMIDMIHSPGATRSLLQTSVIDNIRFFIMSEPEADGVK